MLIVATLRLLLEKVNALLMLSEVGGVSNTLIGGYWYTFIPDGKVNGPKFGINFKLL